MDESLSSALWQDPVVRKLARDCLLHPFVMGIADGSLSLDAFKSFVAQDAFFLEAFSGAYKAAGAAASAAGLPQGIIDDLSELRAGVAEELKMHAAYAKELGISLEGVEPLAAAKAYTDFLKGIAQGAYASPLAAAVRPGKHSSARKDHQDGLLTTLCRLCAALAPCMRLYAFLGQALAGAGATATAGPVFSKWVKEYASVEMEGLAAKLEAVLDACFAQCAASSDENVAAIARRDFVQAMRYELGFFAAPIDATRSSPSPSVPSSSSSPSSVSLRRALLRAARITPPRVLIVAGSDSGGGAGIQADMKACAAAGAFSTTAITAVTAQNTHGVHGVHVLPAAFVTQQMTSVLGDLGTDAVKTGMLATAEIVHAVADQLEEQARWGKKDSARGSARGSSLGLGVAVVVDPVMVSTSGHSLLDSDAVDAYRRRLLPAATLLTPNIQEAQLLLSGPNPNEPSSASGDGGGGGNGGENGGGGGGGGASSAASYEAIRDVAGMERAARALAAMGPAWVLVKGGHLVTNQQTTDEPRGEPNMGTAAAAGAAAGAAGAAEPATKAAEPATEPAACSVDVLCEGATGECTRLSARATPATSHTHGTGCTLAARAAAALAGGASVPEAVAEAKAYVAGAIERSKHLALGGGVQGPMNHHWETVDW